MCCNIKFSDTFITDVFRFFKPFLPVAASKFAKSANMSTFCVSSIELKKQNLMLTSNPSKKLLKSTCEKSYRKKVMENGVFTYYYVQAHNFFGWMKFLQFFQMIRNFETNIEFLHQKFLCHILAFLANFEAKIARNRSKKMKLLFCKRVLELHFGSTSGLLCSILGKKSKSLHSMVQYYRLQPHFLLHIAHLPYEYNQQWLQLKFWLSETLGRKNYFEKTSDVMSSFLKLLHSYPSPSAVTGVMLYIRVSSFFSFSVRASKAESRR